MSVFTIDSVALIAVNHKGLAVLSISRTFKSLMLLACAATLGLLAGCGGGGAKDPFDTGPAAPALIVNPTSLNVYSNLPTVVTISSGVGPFQVFTSDGVVLPVTPVVSGSLVTLVPSNVNADTSVVVTIQDALGRRVAVDVTVKPATLVNQVSVTPVSNTRCGGLDNPLPGQTPSNRTPICSGETATVSAIIRTANSAVIPNRQVRFDVVFGAFRFVTDASGANATTSVTAITDQNGRVTTLIKAQEGVVSQAAVLRATDLVTGNRVDTAFTIVQQINGQSILSVVPGGYTGKSFYKGECGGTSGDFLVYGGRPPYTARSSLPNTVLLSVDTFIGDPVTIRNAGGSFRASTRLDSCVGYEAAIVVTDADGRNVTVTYKEEEGANERPAPPPPATLRISPSEVTFNSCAIGRSVTYSILGGVAPYTLRTDRPADSVVNGTTVSVNAGFVGVINLELTDSSTASTQVKAKITCTS
jgi:hypothetical protein